jgi:hypothetical protein
MLSTRLSRPDNRHVLPQLLEVATKLLLVSTFVLIVGFLFAVPAHAQGSLPLGTIVVGDPVTCPQGSGWFSYSQGGGTPHTMNCFGAIVNCPNTQAISLTFGYLSPVGIVTGAPSQPKGVIVYHNGGPGTSPGPTDYVGTYFTAGYEIVELAWADDWQMTYDPMGSNTPNIQLAACRPATFLNYIYTAIYQPLIQPPNNGSRAGMCAQGDSAGSAAIAYSLAYYGAENWLDNVELVSGPVLSDISQGCQYPSSAQVTVCGLTNYHGGQYGCQLGTNGSTWALSPSYVAGANQAVAKWTNDMTCSNANGLGTTTTPQSAAKWLAQSIVDQSTGGAGQGAIPTFSYSNTGISGWLCRSVLNVTPQYNCQANGNNNSNYCPNNSSTQGQLFYANIGSGNPPANYAVYATDNCQTAEGVGPGNVPGFYPAIFQGTVTGFDAITDDMIGLPPNIPAQCIRRH